MLASAFIFVPLLAFAAMVLFVVLLFTAQFFFTLLECTAHGQRTIEWPKEQFTEWLGMPVRLGWLAGLWLFPAVIISAILVKKTGYVSVGVLFTGVAVALLLPISALSAYIAKSLWTPIHPMAPVLMLKKPFVLLQFYGVVLAVTALGIGGFFLAIFSDAIGAGGAIVGSIAAALAWFLYACALGRLIHVLTYEPPVKRKRVREASSLVAPPTPAKPMTMKKRKKLPPLMTPDGAVEAYGMVADTVPMPDEPEEAKIPHWERPKPHWDQDGDDSPYDAHAPEAIESQAKEVRETIAVPKESEMKLLEKELPPPPPDYPFGQDAFRPMGQSETMRNAMLLAILFGILAGLARTLMDLNPVK